MEYCRQTYLGNFLGIPVARAVEKLHYLSAGAVSFARGLNDTPKIAALLVAAEGLAATPRYALVGLLEIFVGSTNHCWLPRSLSSVWV